ncbi:hypothetical protein [Mesorhizobium sp. 43Arga]
MDAHLPKPASDATLRRAEALDTLDSVLPYNRREVLAEILTDDDTAARSRTCSIRRLGLPAEPLTP